MGRERYCESYKSCPGTEHNVPGARPKPEALNLETRTLTMKSQHLLQFVHVNKQQTISAFPVLDWNQLATEANAGSLFKCSYVVFFTFLMVFPHMNLHCKVVPVQ